MSNDFYYKAPSDEVFEEIKRCAIALWSTYDNKFGYVDEKVNRIKDIQNIRDNTCHIVSMFDTRNQAKLFLLLRNTEAITWFENLIEQQRKDEVGL